MKNVSSTYIFVFIRVKKKENLIIKIVFFKQRLKKSIFKLLYKKSTFIISEAIFDRNADKIIIN